MSFADAPLDPQSAARLAERGLELRLVDTSDQAAFDAWIQADHRGFYGGAVEPERLAETRERTAYRRTTGVFDASAADPATPIATAQSWPTRLTVPGDDASVGLWAISSVTVAPTHRRRGVARAMLEAELRTAAALGVPVAGLTVSEATIYGRYGFGPAGFVDEVEIETDRMRWAGRETPGRLHFVTPEQLRDDARAIAEAARGQQPGELLYDDALLDGAIGLTGTPGARQKRRLVRYDDAAGTSRGFVLYEVEGGDDDFTKHTVQVHYLLGADDEATAALWRFLVELDLVTRVRAPMRPVDEPLAWMLGDLRAIRRRRADHLWLRILDVPAALEARRYAAAASIVLDVDDPYGFAAGRFLLEVGQDGAGRVRRTEGEAPTDAASVALAINELSSVYLGGVAPTELARAGRIAEQTPGAAGVLEAAFRSERAPWLSMEF
ncbi:GNAT family N-acetyltransferase [Gryllotalpicola ginsengisoli]|uniref:GNAT family N-acetyltransferase n=1 Tax=Gryllotalpicola ginsengisoli TaxID=444608 RepID=UPI00052418C5|nr:GNAT family N-acetyltransferase [Gryllotalpicola ginsengisoli]